jgi:hypothetical protein
MSLLYFFAQILDPSKVNIPKTTADPGHLTSIFNLVLAIMGALAFFMLILAGFRYTISQGDANRVADAKRQIIYTLVGLVVLALAATVVNFVIGRS